MENQSEDKVKKPLDVAVILAIAVPLTACISIVGAWYMKDGALASDLIKGFIGPSLLVIVNYYFGTSRSSAAKDGTIEKLASAKGAGQDGSE